MTRRLVLTACLLALVAAPAPAVGRLDEAVSYTKPVPGGFVFAMLGDPEAEAKAPEDARARFAQLRAKYPKTGLYRDGSGELIWAVADGQYAPYDNVHLAADGVHLVRLDGDWWREKDFTGGRAQLSDEEVRKQLDSPAVSFFAGGKLLKQYTVRDVIANPDGLPQTPRYLLWLADGVMNEDTGRFVLTTQDSHRLTFDYRTGELLARAPAGLGNPLLTAALIASGALTAAILGVWAYLVFVRKPKVAAAGPRGGKER
ncbi:MAG TPA: hypothetical protein VFG68_18920 [Fimbriiglobus sp.]|nr:hypothetical protein [Fimbriiglobus sp.]